MPKGILIPFQIQKHSFLKKSVFVFACACPSPPHFSKELRCENFKYGSASWVLWVWWSCQILQKYPTDCRVLGWRRNKRKTISVLSLSDTACFWSVYTNAWSGRGFHGKIKFDRRCGRNWQGIDKTLFCDIIYLSCFPAFSPRPELPRHVLESRKSPCSSSVSFHKHPLRSSVPPCHLVRLETCDGQSNSHFNHLQRLANASEGANGKSRWRIRRVA